MLGSIYAMVGVALTLSIGVLKFLNFSIPGLFMLGGMMTWVLIHYGLPWPLAALGALAVGARGVAGGRAVHLALDALRAGVRAAGQLDGILDPVREPGRQHLGLGLQTVPPLFGGSDWRDRDSWSAFRSCRPRLSVVLIAACRCC